ncbi:Uncharacterised protein [Actinomyces bovis]|uniref:Uncharacterized protein n=1 Tax=Actinomyces bovis TaxID=1658 RepID=A0ABY1VLX0_9ACTO|nr:hypothetical protein [Actinomyces bovis]SPT53101.1 Uncharacterised protein [Actinomyces bovis]
MGYLPLLVLARSAAARTIRDLHVHSDDDAPWLPAIALATGVALLGAFSASSYRFWMASVLAGVLIVWACARVFPAGVTQVLRGRPAALAVLTWLSGAYFSLDYLISPAAHDVLGLTVTLDLNSMNSLPNLCWIIVNNTNWVTYNVLIP